MIRVDEILTNQAAIAGQTYRNYTHVSGIYSRANEPMFLSFADNVHIPAVLESFSPSDTLPNATADSNSARVLKSILSARIPAAQPGAVWDNDELLP
jgi:hypothetical protein